MLHPVLAERFKLQPHPNTAKAYPNGMHHGQTIFVIGPGADHRRSHHHAGPALTLYDRGEQSLGHPLIDKTRLTGKYDFILQLPLPASDSNDEQQQSAALFTAVQEQLGLKLQP